ncbi:MAG: hypothetical protein V4573_13975 [Pseudomonadota bacterium]
MKTNVKTALNFFARPRYLRAIPSLVVLTTAMAWGMVPDTADGDGDGAQKKARVTLSSSAQTPAVVAQGLNGSQPSPDA